MTNRLDPITLEVIHSALATAAEEMSLVVMRSARSPLLREAGDLSSALTDARGEMIAQGRDIPMHLGVMCFTVKEFLKRVPPSAMSPGDVWFLNLPEIGGNHLPDVKAIRPIFAQDQLFAFAVSLAHWADIGGAAPGSYFASATDIWQEGLRISPTPLQFARTGAGKARPRAVKRAWGGRARRGYPRSNGGNSRRRASTPRPHCGARARYPKGGDGGSAGPVGTANAPGDRGDAARDIRRGGFP